MRMLENSSLELFGQVAAVVECGKYTYQETMAALSRLSKYYEENAQMLLRDIPITQIAQYRQREYEKTTVALDESVAVEDQP